MTGAEISTLKYFHWDEFRNPEKVDYWCAQKLDQLRALAGQPLFITDDARTPEDAPPGSAGLNSLHQTGRAFDIRIRGKTGQLRWALNSALVALQRMLPVDQSGMEVEWVQGPMDQHLHVGFFRDSRPSRFELNTE